MKFCIKSADGKMAVFRNSETDDLFICNADMKESGANKLYKTDSRDKAVRAWLLTGGDHNGLKIYEVE